MSISSIALAVPCYRERARLAPLAEAVSALDPQPAAKLAVDDCSEDGTDLALRAAGFEVLVHPVHRGLGGARNTLWRRAEELGMSVVVFLDADVTPQADLLSRVQQGLSEPRGDGADPWAGLGGQNLERAPTHWVDAWRLRFWPQSLGGEALEDAPCLIGACSAYRIEALKEVGGFDEGHRSHGEDVDVGRRLRAAGCSLRYDPSIVVWHRRSDAATDLLRSCFLHCREGMRAARRSPALEPTPAALVLGMVRKLVRAPASSLLLRRDLREAALGFAACSAGLLGYLVGWSVPDRVP